MDTDNLGDKTKVQKEKRQTNQEVDEFKPKKKIWLFQVSAFVPSFHPAASGDSSQLLNPVTSALISGVVILGGISVGFFLLSVRLLQKSRLQAIAASGVWNPSFK